MRTCSICPRVHHAKGFCNVHYWRDRQGKGLNDPFRGRPLDPARCGTDAQERAHRRRGEKPCDACRRAHNEACRQRHPLKTHCKNGHEFTPENTDCNSAGRRECRTCMGRGLRARLRVPSFLREMYGEAV